MKIVIVVPVVPFEAHAGRVLAADLKAATVAAGHEAEIVGFPVRRDDRCQPERSAASAGQLFLGQADAVIALGFPVYALQHERLIVWLAETPPRGEIAPEFLADVDRRAAEGACGFFRVSDDLPAMLGGRALEHLPAPTDSAAWGATLEMLLA